MRAPVRTFTRAKRLRREMTLPEVLLWARLRRVGLGGSRWRRQHPIGPYILDFYCPDLRLAVEVDGESHDFAERAAHDERRTAWLSERGIRILRFPARDVLKDETLDEILSTIAALVPPP